MNGILTTRNPQHRPRPDLPQRQFGRAALGITHYGYGISRFGHDQAGEDTEAVLVDFDLVEAADEDMSSGHDDAGDWRLGVGFESEQFLEDDAFGGDAEMVEFEGPVVEAHGCDYFSFLVVLKLDHDGVHFQAGDFLDLSVNDFKLALVEQAALLKRNQAH